MTMSLRQLLTTPSLGLVVRCAGLDGAQASAVHWVHQSELSDSRLFTEPGEVLLTTGSHLPDARTVSPADLVDYCDRYIGQLCESQVVGLGFGIGVYYATTPDVLVEAAARHGLPLFEVPYEIPFSAVTKTVSKSLSDAEHAYLRRTNSAQRRLITAVGRPQVVPAVVRSTGHIIGGWAALTDPSGQVLVLSPSADSGTVERAARSHLDTGQQVSFPGPVQGLSCAHSIVDSKGHPLGVLLTGASTELEPLAISTSMLAANLVGMHLSLSGKLERALDGLRGPLIREALEGRPELARELAGVLWPTLPTEPLALVCITGVGPTVQVPLEDLPAVWGMVSGRLWVVTEAVQVPRITALVNRRSGLHCGSSSATDWAGLSRAKAEALNALLGCGQSDEQLDLLDLLPPEQAATFALRRLGELLEPDTAELFATVRTWAGHDGSFDQTATALGVHRHTVRRRMKRVQEMLDISLDDPQLRHELWFACQIAERLELVPTAATSAA